MNQDTGADTIGQALAKAGATHAFGIPGGEVLALMDGLRRAKLQFKLTKHENAAGFIAEGVWHANGALPVVVATIGPGVANAVNVIANAHQDKVPMIFLTGCVDGAEAETYTHQVFDHQAMLRPVVKASFRAETGAVGPMIAKAIAIALDGQPGPVHIDVPISVAEGPGDTPVPPLPINLPFQPDMTTLDTCRGVLDKAQRPIAIVGVDALNQGAHAEVDHFCRQRGIPVITSYKAKGMVDENDPLCVGAAGLSPKADKILLPLLAEADCILLIGYDPIEMRIGWRNPWPDNTPVIELANVPRLHGMHSVTHTLRGTVAETLVALGHEGSGALWPDAQPSKARSAMRDAFAPDGWGPGTIFDTLYDVMPPRTVVTADSGAHRILLSQQWMCREPRQMLQSTGLCTMACAVPLAIGQCLGSPLPVLAFVGDAGLEMGAGELATLRDWGLPVIICVLVDRSLALIEMKQRGSQRPELGVSFGATDFPAVANAFGGHGVWIDDVDSLRKEAQDGLARDGFTLLACRIDKKAYDGTF